MTVQQAMTAAEWMEFYSRVDRIDATNFLHDDHEQDRETPGPYEQGSNLLRQATFDEYWD